MSQSKQKNKKQIRRFAAVGIINTAVDFILLFVLKYLGLPAVVANFISSTVAFGFSFIANKNYTFETAGRSSPRQVILFTVVTLIGLWVLQSLVIYFTESLLVVLLGSDELALLASKLLATAVSMTWNYVMYANIVFKQDVPRE